MASDASIYGLQREQKPLPGPVDQFSQVLNLRNLMTQNRLHELQAQDTEQTLGEKEAFRQGLAGLAPGETLESATPRLMRVAPLQTLDLQQKLLTQKKLTGEIEHTGAQTGDITAGHIAGAFAALAKGNGSDQAVQDAETMMTPLVGAQKAQAVSQKLLTMPPEQRLAYAVAQAGQHKTGQEALKLFFPPATMRDTGAEVQPVSTSTLPGDAPAGTPIPGTTPLKKTATPGELLTDARQREMNGILAGQAPTDTAATVDALGTHQIPLPPRPSGARNPMGQQRWDKLFADVKAKYPNFSADQFPTVQKTENAFAVGKEGGQLKKLSTATDHLETLRELLAATKNGNVQLFNRIANQYAANTGNPAPSNLATAAQIIGSEIIGGIVAGPGGEAERGRAEGAFSNVKSPADVEGAINTVTKLMGGQFKGLKQQYEAGTYGRQGFAERFLTPAARKALDTASAPKAAGGGGGTAGGWKIEEVK